MARHIVRGRFEVTSTITPELYDTKFNYIWDIFYQFWKWEENSKKNPRHLNTTDSIM